VAAILRCSLAFLAALRLVPLFRAPRPPPRPHHPRPRPRVLARRGGGPWDHLPAVSGRQDKALEDVTHLRLYFPFWDEPQGKR